jgi:branched-chain amino acid transport system substrate-binding protein
MSKWIATTLMAAGVATLAGFGPGTAATAVAAEPVVKVGYLLPLTGEYSKYGAMFRNAANIVVESFNAADNGFDLEIVYEDTKSDPKDSANVAAKFVDNKSIVAVLGDFSSSASMAAGEVLAKGGVPQLSQTASHPDYTKVSKWQFRNITTQAQEGPFNARWILGKYRKAAVIAIQNDWGLSAAENFVKSYEAGGGKVVEQEFFNPGLRDFKSVLTKIKRANPDVIYLCMFDEQGSALLQQAKQLGIGSAMYSTSALYSPKLLELAGPAADGLFLATTFVGNSPEPNVKTFVDAYKKRYSEDPSQFAAQAYDAVGIMLQAIKRAGGAKATRESVRDALAQTKDFPGVTGVTTFDPQTREPSKVLSKLTVQSGAFTIVK